MEHADFAASMPTYAFLARDVCVFGRQRVMWRGRTGLRIVFRVEGSFGLSACTAVWLDGNRAGSFVALIASLRPIGGWHVGLGLFWTRECFCGRLASRTTIREGFDFMQLFCLLC